MIIVSGGDSITVYIDVLVFINIIEDFLLLNAVRLILRLRVRYYRLLLSAAVGGFLSLTALLYLPFAVNLPLKVAGAALMTLATFGFKGKRLFVKTCTTLFVITFLFSGAMICFYLALKPRGMAIINDVAYFDISPLLLIILTVIIYFILLLYRKLFKNHKIQGTLHKVNILYNNINYTVICKTDSGMNVKEPFSGSRVIIVERAQLAGLNINSIKLRAIPFRSLGGSGIIFGFLPDSVTVDGRLVAEEMYVGLCENILKSESKGLIPEDLGEQI